MGAKADATLALKAVRLEAGPVLRQENRFGWHFEPVGKADAAAGL
jgi:hypothetical protein